MADLDSQPTDDGRVCECGHSVAAHWRHAAECDTCCNEARRCRSFRAATDVDQRATARARRDEARTALITRGQVNAICDDGDALDAALESVEQERDALKAECLRLALDNGHLRRQMHRAVAALLSAQSVDLVVDMLRSVSVEEGTGHEPRN